MAGYTKRGKLRWQSILRGVREGKGEGHHRDKNREISGRRERERRANVENGEITNILEREREKLRYGRAPESLSETDQGCKRGRGRVRGRRREISGGRGQEGIANGGRERVIEVAGASKKP